MKIKGIAAIIGSLLLVSINSQAAELFEDTFAPSCTADADNDRLPDCREYSTGNFRSHLDTGTNPYLADTDADGLDDGDEVLGTVGGLDLRALGVSPVRKDVLIEFDWFYDLYSGNGSFHSHQPTPRVIGLLTEAFAKAPVSNPDRSSGIKFIADYGQGGLFSGGNQISGFEPRISNWFLGEFAQIKGRNFAPNRLGMFHYALMPHEASAENFAEMPGDDLVVTERGIAQSDPEARIAAVIMHEIGHNFNLHHGGDVACNYKPNYNSVMNYRFIDTIGVDRGPTESGGCDADGDDVLSYSTGARRPLNEAALNEGEGVCYSGPAIDWNRNGVIEFELVLDLYPWYLSLHDQPECGGRISLLRDYNDWGNLMLIAVSTAAKSMSSVVSCRGL